MLKFYYAPRTCALATHIALEEAGASYELVKLDFSKEEQRGASYLAINPKARVPALQTERGVLTETPAMLSFVAQTHPAARLAPLDDPFAFADMQAFTSYLCSTVHVAHAHKTRGYRWADETSSIEDMKRKTPKNVAACYELIEGRMLKGPWVLGDMFTVADPYLYTVSQWLAGDGIDIATYPKVADHHRRMAERPAVRRAIDAELR